jgi:hypothetical protein
MAAADIFCAVSRSPSAAILKRYHLLFSTSIFSDESNNNGSTDLPFKSTIFFLFDLFCGHNSLQYELCNCLGDMMIGLISGNHDHLTEYVLYTVIQSC